MKKETGVVLGVGTVLVLFGGALFAFIAVLCYLPELFK